MKSTDLIKLLVRHGWHEIRQQGPHHIFSHSANPSVISVPDTGEKPLTVGLLNDILKEAGFKARVRKIRFSLYWLGSLINSFRINH
jgi:predicted RNA binding protein YcfA (HicA-like mRNA interferase family)